MIVAAPRARPRGSSTPSSKFPQPSTSSIPTRSPRSPAARACTWPTTRSSSSRWSSTAPCRPSPGAPSPRSPRASTAAAGWASSSIGATRIPGRPSPGRSATSIARTSRSRRLFATLEERVELSRRLDPGATWRAPAAARRAPQRREAHEPALDRPRDPQRLAARPGPLHRRPADRRPRLPARSARRLSTAKTCAGSAAPSCDAWPRPESAPSKNV